MPRKAAINGGDTGRPGPDSGTRTDSGIHFTLEDGDGGDSLERGSDGAAEAFQTDEPESYVRGMSKASAAALAESFRHLHARNGTRVLCGSDELTAAVVIGMVYSIRVDEMVCAQPHLLRSFHTHAIGLMRYEELFERVAMAVVRRQVAVLVGLKIGLQLPVKVGGIPASQMILEDREPGKDKGPR